MKSKSFSINTFPEHKVALKLAKRLYEELSSGEKVFLILAGGSSIKVYEELGALLLKEPLNLRNIKVAVSDERFTNGKDNNLSQILNTSFGKLLNDNQIINTIPGERDLSHFTSDLEVEYEAAFESYDKSIAILGLGTKGHIAGIEKGNPGSSPGQEGALIHSYTAKTLKPKERVTLTYEGLKRIDKVYVYAVGKEEVLNDLEKGKKMPASILNDLKPEVYTDLSRKQ